MLVVSLIGLCAAFDLAKKFDSNVEGRAAIKGALWEALQPYVEDGYVSKASLKKAYDARDEYGQPLALPPKHIVNHEIDYDHDGLLSKAEVMAWPGLQHKYCRTLGDASYGCVPKCPAGIDTFDGNPNYFLEKYSVNMLRNVNISQENTGVKYYAGGWTPAQKLAVRHMMASVLQKDIGGDVVQMGLKDVNSWKELRELLGEHDKTQERQLYLYDTFAGMPACDHEFDTGMCPHPGSERVSLQSIQREVAKIRKEAFVPNVKSFEKYSMIPGKELPDKIAFAVLDGSLYHTIDDMLHKVYPRLATGGKIIIHDFGWEGYPGIQKAIDTFLENTRGAKIRLAGSEHGIACYMAELVKVIG